MTKALSILIYASLLFMGLKTIFPKERIDKLFINSSETQFEQLLSEQISDTIDNKNTAKKTKAVVKKKRVKHTLKDQKKQSYLSQDTKNKLTNKSKPTVKKKSIKLTRKEKNKLDSINQIIDNKTTNRRDLKHFFTKLQDLKRHKKRQVRIAFFGDSMEDGDMIVMQLRYFLQQKFGGLGVGYVPIKSITANGRYSIKHRYSKGWNQSNFMRKGYGRFPFGLNGKTFYVGNSKKEGEATVTYKKGSAYKNLPLIYPTLFYGKKIIDSTHLGSKAVISYTLNNNVEFKKIALKKNKLVNTYRLPNNPKGITIKLKDQQTLPFYGVSFASKYGVIVDNLSIRGNSGLPLIKLNSKLMQQFDKLMTYDLIILAYGTNAFSFKNKEYSWYKSKMIKNIRHIQKCFPNADILVSSMGDCSQKIDGKMQTPKHLPNFINTQYKIARSTNSGFYNLYKQMGGKNSMVKWAEKDNLANKDYMHFNPQGAKKAGKMFYNWLMTHYDNAVKNRKKIEKNKEKLEKLNKAYKNKVLKKHSRKSLKKNKTISKRKKK